MNASGSGECSGATRPPASASSAGASFASALSPMRGIDAWPARPRAVSVKRKTPFSATQTP